MDLEKQKNSAAQIPQIQVVEASAGSGKTYALAKRYVNLLLDPTLPEEQIPLRNILAITFTNKAALEMKERVLEFVKRCAIFGDQRDELFFSQPGFFLNTEKIKQKASAAMGLIIRNYNFFQVQTIDSFINTLLCGCAFKIGLSANFKIKRNAVDYLHLSMDRLIDRAKDNKDVQKIFDDFLQQYLFLENRTSWFPKKDILSLIATLFSQSNMLGLRYCGVSSSLDDLLPLKKNILKLIQQLRADLPEGTDGRFVKSLDSFRNEASYGFDVDAVPDYFSREEFPVTKGHEVCAAVEQLWQDIRRQLERLCDLESTSIFNCYITIFQEVLSDLKEIVTKEDILFLEELNKKARLLFDEQAITVEELYYRLATRFRYYLIDEFQDTSVLQWQNLVAMVEEALASGGTLFYVGDKKQAIYGFRGGEAALFDLLKKRFQSFGVSLETLGKNYRSHKGIVDFNNVIFSVANLKKFLDAKENFEIEKKKKNILCLTLQEKEEITGVFENSQQISLTEKSEGYVRMEYIDAENKEDRDSFMKPKLITLIKELRQRFSYRDIALLVRNNQEVETLTSWLLAEGLFVESERTSNIRENFLVKELISFLRFLDSPIDNLSFASFILGDIFAAATRVDLAQWHRFIFELRLQITKEKDFYLYKEFREQYPQIWETFIEEFFKTVGMYPLYELVLSIVHRFECAQNFSGFQGFLMRFLELIKDQEKDHSDITSFLEFFEEATTEDLYVHVSDSDTVKILTIHKAKGLEFPVVIIPFLGMDIQVGHGSGPGEKSYVVEPKDGQLQLIHLKQKYLGFSENLQEIYRREYKKSLLVELNCVYVALTRASHELYGFIPKRIGNSFNVLKFLLPETSLELGRKVTYPPEPHEEEKFLKLPPSQYRDWIDLLHDEFAGVTDFKNREKILKGEAIHFILSSVGNLSSLPSQEQEELLQQALAACQAQFVFLNDLTAFKSIVSDLLMNTQLKPFFFVEEAQVFQEKDIVTVNGQTRRIDRLIVKENEVWIVDYKSHRELIDLHQHQVREYISILNGLYPGKIVKGFLIYLEEMMVEEVLGV